jgi:hypothetical protein
MPETATIQILMDGSDEEEILKNDLKDYINNEIADELAERGQLKPEFANSIEECTDTSKLYVLPDGYVYGYISKTIVTPGGTRPNFTNLMDKPDSYIREGVRYSQSSAAFKDDTTTATVVVPIPAVTNITIRVRNATLNKTPHGNAVYYGVNNEQFPNTGSGTSALTITKEANGDITITYDNKSTANKYVVYHVDAGFSNNNPIVTVNEEITYTTVEESTETIAEWRNTGHAFVPADYEDRIVILENDNSVLKNKVKALENAVVYGDGVPDYVISEAEEVADKILSVRNSNSFVMALASDFHTKGTDASSVSVAHAGQGMNVINSMTQIDLVALLGDYEHFGFSYGDTDTDGEDARESFKTVKKAFYEVGKNVPVMWLQGNHDELPADTTEVARQKYYAYIGANNVGSVVDYSNKFRNYGYRDFENYKVRVVHLNSTDVSDSSVTGNCYVSTEQLNWMNSTALKLPDSNWMVIVLSHHPLNWDGMSGVLSALNEFKGTGKSVIHFHGHLHNFRAETLGANGVPTITIPNACFGRENEYGTAYPDNPTMAQNYGDADGSGNQRVFYKSANTADDTAFNVVVVDRESKKIHCINYGAGTDREISY